MYARIYVCAVLPLESIYLCPMTAPLPPSSKAFRWYAMFFVKWLKPYGLNRINKNVQRFLNSSRNAARLPAALSLQ